MWLYSIQSHVVGWEAEMVAWDLMHNTIDKLEQMEERIDREIAEVESIELGL